MDSNQVGQLFIKELSKLIRKDLLLNEKISHENELLMEICQTAIKDTGIQFHTAFSIIAYTGHRYNLPGRLLYNVHKFRRNAGSVLKNGMEDEEVIENLYLLGLKVCSDLIRIIYEVIPTAEILGQIPSDKVYLYREDKVVHFKKYQRVLILKRDEEEEKLIAIDQSRPEKSIEIRYNVDGRNEIFNDTIALLGAEFRLPIEVNLVDVEIDEQGVYLPKAFVFEPDFLIDITAVAECFSDYGIADVSYLTRKFLPVGASKYLMLGHIANFFLDELMADTTLTFQTLIGQVFKLNPLAFSLFDDKTAREIVQKAQKHYVSLRTVILQTFPKEGIKVENCFLEPTFYSERYGLQGRLDVLHDNPDLEDDASIIELKSGKPFRANAYGLSHNHYVQTLLYDLLIKSMSNDKLKPTNYILYTVKDTDHLRFAPAVRFQQYEALAARNRLLALDARLIGVNEMLDRPDHFIQYLTSDHYVKGFTKRDLELYAHHFDALTILEKKYFISMAAMIAREHRLSKVGQQGHSTNKGQAALWLTTSGEKESQFNIISHLIIQQNATHEVDPVLSFTRTDRTNPLANFRRGDLAIVYPWSDKDSPLSSQLFKGTIVELDSERVSVRLRAKQFNSSVFEQHEFWNIEHDVLDSSFLGLFRSLYSYTQAPLEDRKRFLTLRPPAPPKPCKWESLSALTMEQNRIMAKILSASDYFLLWGPPGTGKTSIMLKHLVSNLYSDTDEQILLLAYTNRAVDEICRAMIELDEDHKVDFLRVGSRYATHPDFAGYLLGNKLGQLNSRQQLRDLIGSYRIIVGTISSVMGKRELFALKTFDRVIVDEATQVLEPMMAGLVPQFKKVLLIGDHKQLPAVVTQSESDRKVSDTGLHAIGLGDLGNSYFERVYHRCIQEGWDWAYDRLIHQGRMHADIMKFPSVSFYGSMLETLPVNTKRGAEQVQPLNLSGDNTPLLDLLASQRVIFFPVISDELISSKTNYCEAKSVAKLVPVLMQLWSKKGEVFDSSELGIITPYRAQIAMIREQLSLGGLSDDEISIDTVERYQGGARSIIIISLCINSQDQLENLVSISADGVDRKLNVALTRAREQLIVLGNPEILGKNKVYRDFMDRYQTDVTILEVT